MSEHETPLFPDWYINFQSAILKQLPRPNKIDQTTAQGWERNQEALRSFLKELVPQKTLEKDQPVLLHEQNVPIITSVSPFVVRDYFKKTEDGYVDIASIGESLSLIIGEIVEFKESCSSMICVHRVLQSCHPNKIIKEIGEEKTIVEFQEIYEFLKIADKTKKYICMTQKENLIKARYEIGKGWHMEKSPFGVNRDERFLSH